MARQSVVAAVLDGAPRDSVTSHFASIDDAGALVDALHEAGFLRPSEFVVA